MKKPIHSTAAPEAIGPYSQAVLVDGWLFASGQVPIDPATGELVQGDIRVQTARVFENLQAVLAEAGGSLHDVVKTTVYLKDMASFAAMNEVYAEAFGDTRPARATVEVSELPKGAEVEIELVARIGSM